MIENVEYRIRARAYEIWEREGRPSDRAEAHWGMAVAEVTAETTPAPAAKVSAPRKIAAAAVAAAPKRRSAASKAAKAE